MAAVRALGISRTSACGFFVRFPELGSSQFLQNIFRLPQYQQRLQFSVVALYPPSASSIVAIDDEPSVASSLLDKLRDRQFPNIRDSPKSKSFKETQVKKKVVPSSAPPPREAALTLATSFRDLLLSDELLSAVDELGISQPTEVQCRSIPAVLDGQSVVIASHTGSGKTLAYMIPLVQLLRKDEIELNVTSRPRRPRAVVLCPTRELAEQVYRVAKSICHHAKFRATLIGGGVRMRPQEDALNAPIDMLVGTPGRLLKHIEDGNMAYGDIKYVVLDEADTMFDRGFGPDIKKFFGPLRNRSLKAENAGFQTILVTATITQGVQKLLDDEFPGIKHIRTATLHKKVSSARHGFIKLSGTENKLESLLQVLEPSLSKGERVMVFCNTLNSCRAIDHFLSENNIPTVNYHGAVPADERVEVLNKFKNEDGKCPALVCTDLAARGLDLVVDHVIMFDFPLNSIDYLHRTGRTARMGAKGKVTSLVTKRNLALAEQIETAIQKGQALDGVSVIRKEAVEVKKQALRTKLKDAGRIGRLATQKRKHPDQIKASASGSTVQKPTTRTAAGPKFPVSKSARKTALVVKPSTSGSTVQKSPTRTAAGSKFPVSKSARKTSVVKITKARTSVKPAERKMARTSQKVMKFSNKR